jgi:ribosome hibernation promoting factor
MKIEVKGRNLQVNDELRDCVARRFEKVGKQVSELAVLDVELCEEKLPGTRYTATAELRVKGTTLRAKDASKDVKHAINLVADDMARQVKRHRDKRRARRESRALSGAGAPPPPAAAEAGTESLPAL